MTHCNAVVFTLTATNLNFHFLSYLRQRLDPLSWKILRLFCVTERNILIFLLLSRCLDHTLNLQLILNKKLFPNLKKQLFSGRIS